VGVGNARSGGRAGMTGSALTRVQLDPFLFSSLVILEAPALTPAFDAGVNTALRPLQGQEGQCQRRKLSLRVSRVRSEATWLSCCSVRGLRGSRPHANLYRKPKQLRSSGRLATSSNLTSSPVLDIPERMLQIR